MERVVVIGKSSKSQGASSYSRDRRAVRTRTATISSLSIHQRDNVVGDVTIFEATTTALKNQINNFRHVPFHTYTVRPPSRDLRQSKK